MVNKVVIMVTEVNCRFVEIDDDWDQQVAAFNFDIYHLSGWLKSSTIIDGGECKGLIVEAEDKQLLFPLIIRKINEEFWDATSTYGYGGPLGDNLLSVEDLNYLLEQTIIFLKQHHCVSLFMRLHPILNANWNVGVGTVVTHGPTLSSDLTKTEEEHWSETQTRHRRGINKALKNSISTKIEKLNHENALSFCKIYTETMQHLNASDFYFFDQDYFLNLAKNLPDRLLLITAFDQDKPIAASIYTLCQESQIMQYHLGGTLDTYRDLQPAKLITHVARTWGRENKYSLLHLGGGLGASLDSLYEYKKGFSSNEHLFKTHRIVVNQDIYIKLLDQNTKVGDITKFFTLYRKLQEI